MDPELQAELERLAGNTGYLGDAFDRISRSLQSGFPDWNRANGNVRLFGREVGESSKKAKTAFEKFSTGLKSSVGDIKSGFKSLGDESQSGAKAIKNITDSLGSAVSGFASQFGIVGGVVGAAATAITGMTGVALGFVDELSTTTKKLGEAGIAFGDTLKTGSGIDEFDALIKSAGLSAGILNTVIDNSSESLRLFSGGAANGLRTVTQGFKKLKEANNGQYESLVKLGYSTEEMMEGMADFGATARLAGQDLNMDQLADGTAKYLTMQRELTRLTGTSVKEAKAREEALKSDLAYQAMLREISADNAKVLTEVMTNVPKSIEPLVKTLVTGGAITDQQMALLKNALGEDADFFIKLGEQAKNINLDPEQVNKELAGVLPKLAKNVENYADQFGSSFIQTILNKGGPLAELFQLLGAVSLELEPGQAASESLVDTTKNVASGMGNIAKALPEIEKASIALRSALYTTGSALTATFAPMIMGMASTVEGGAAKFQDALNKYSSMLNQTRILEQEQVGRGGSASRFQTEEEKQEAINKVIADSIGSIAPQGSIFDKLFEELGDKISLAITEGFTQVMLDYDPLSTSKREAIAFESTDGFKELKDAINKLKPGEEINAIGSANISKLDAYLGAFEGDLRNTKIAELGLKSKEVDEWFGWFGTKMEWFEKIAPATPPASSIPDKAFGDIMNPKPGGHIVRVAEAGEAEAIMPTKRGANGRLGLEVSGAMFDNSRLLQNLVKVNEAQASMMAGLTSQMTNMNTNFEKLVYEQRQANRLAV